MSVCPPTHPPTHSRLPAAQLLTGEGESLLAASLATGHHNVKKFNHSDLQVIYSYSLEPQ